MIQLYAWDTPNGRKISVALEEMGLTYRVEPVDITKGRQFAPDFLAISPNNRIPAIVDAEGPDGRRSRCSNPARSWSTSPRRPGCSCPLPGAAGSRSWNG